MAPLVVPHDPEWAAAFAAEAWALTGAMGETCTALHHIGSTAIPGILAKPIIDILCEVSSFELLDGATRRIESLGYTAMGALASKAAATSGRTMPRGVGHTTCMCLKPDRYTSSAIWPSATICEAIRRKLENTRR